MESLLLVEILQKFQIAIHSNVITSCDDVILFNMYLLDVELDARFGSEYAASSGSALADRIPPQEFIVKSMQFLVGQGNEDEMTRH